MAIQQSERSILPRAALVCVLSALILPLPAAAQVAVDNARMVGIKAGIASLETRAADAPSAPDPEAFSSATFGIFGRLPLGGNVAAQSELLYLKQGAGEGDVELRKEVLRLPVTLQVLVPAGGWGVRIYGGGTLDFALSCSYKQVGFPANCPVSSGGGALGLAVGGQVERMFGASVLVLDLRYDHGLSRLEGGGSFADLRGFRGFEVTVGYGRAVGRSSRQQGGSE